MRLALTIYWGLLTFIMLSVSTLMVIRHGKGFAHLYFWALICGAFFVRSIFKL